MSKPIEVKVLRDHDNSHPPHYHKKQGQKNYFVPTRDEADRLAGYGYVEVVADKPAGKAEGAGKA